MNILLIGKPASGKGTISQELLKTGNFVHLSTGDLLREEVNSGSKLGKEIDDLLKEGNFATDSMVFKMVFNFIAKNADKNIIFDGFPRNLKQAHKCKELGIDFDLSIIIDIEDKVVKSRILNRLVHQPSGRVYNLKFNKPKVAGLDDITGEPLTRRNDDVEDKLLQRLKNYNELTAPVALYYRENSSNTLEINGDCNIRDNVDGVINKVDGILYNKNKSKIR